MAEEIETKNEDTEIKEYSKDEVLEASVKYFDGDELAASTFQSKYALRHQVSGEDKYRELTPDAMHDRLAEEFARIESKYPNPLSKEEIREYFNQFDNIVPQGSPMYGIGNPFVNVSLSNCVVAESPKDTISSIFDTSKHLANLYKRRCVEENTFVSTQENGVIPIKDVEVNMHVRSFNAETKIDTWCKVTGKFKSDVSKDKRVQVRVANGCILKTSADHPVLVFNEDGYVYQDAGNLLPGDTIIIPSKQEDLSINCVSRDLTDKAWWIGAHIGDGAANLTKQKNIRFRMVKDNKSVVEAYTNIANSIIGSKCNVKPSTRKDYKIPCWNVTICNNSTQSISDELLDGQIGSKVYTAKVPTFIKKHQLWWPFIAGLIDTDGTIKNGSSIVVSICAKSIIDSVSVFLASNGIRFHVADIKSKRKNEKNIYRLAIHVDAGVYALIYPFLKNEKKRDLIASSPLRSFSSKSYKATKDEFSNLFENYSKLSSRGPSNLSSIISYARKETATGFGIGALNEFVSSCIMDKSKAYEIMQRISVVEITDDLESENYWDISVENTNNFYAGNFGLFNVHNCGVGLSLDNLRPEGAIVKNAAGTSTGSVSFAEHYSNTTRLIGQAGRRGASMQTMSIFHPDIDNFVTVKRDDTKITGSNISVMLGDDFMNSVADRGEWITRWPVTANIEEVFEKGGKWEDASKSDIITTYKGRIYDTFMKSINYQFWVSNDKSERRVVKKFKAKDLWRLINESAVMCAEPGLLFWDNYCNNLPANCYEDFKSISTNPCAEISLSAMDACRLLTINLKNYVKNPFVEKSAYFDKERFAKTVRVAQRLMDDLVDLEIEHLQKIIDSLDDKDEIWLWSTIQKTAINGRRTGLGTHGLGDCLARLCVKYDMAETEVEEIYKIFAENAYSSSVDLAKERGAFPVFDWSLEKDNIYIKRLPQYLQDDISKYGRRNISLLTLAPTGSVSILSQTSSGLEPVFSNYYTRRKKINPSDKDARVDFIDQNGDSWTHFEVYHKNIQDWLELNPGKKKEWQNIKNTIGAENWSDSIKKILPNYFVTASDIDAMKRIKIQSVLTNFLDHGSSSTVNLPRDTGVEIVQGLYEEAWRLGLKGVTVYVDGSRSGVLINKEKQINPNEIQDSHAPKRPAILEADIHRSNISNQEWIILVGKLNDRPYEIFGGLSESIKIPKRVTAGKIVKRKCEKANAKGRLSCYDLVVGEDDDAWTIGDIAVAFNDGNYAWATRLISQGLRHGVPINFITEQLGRDLDSNLFSFNKVMARILKKYVKDGTSSGARCETCGEKLVFSEGCQICMNCGQSKCG